MKTLIYARHRFHPDIIKRAVWMYFKFNLSFIVVIANSPTFRYEDEKEKDKFQHTDKATISSITGVTSYQETHSAIQTGIIFKPYLSEFSRLRRLL